jgi:hypothetical protein
MAFHANHPNFHVAVFPFQVFLPVGSWGISYDISTNKTEFDAPDGWYAWRSMFFFFFFFFVFCHWKFLTYATGATYKALIRHLMIMGFYRHQYSDYRLDNTTGVNAWLTALSLKFIDPPMKLETTVLGLKIHYYSNLHFFDLTDYVQIGGIFSQQLRGPIPASLLPAGGVVVGMNGGPPVHPGLGFPLPKYTQPSAETLDPNNWFI